jgi:TonB family protein
LSFWEETGKNPACLGCRKRPSWVCLALLFCFLCSDISFAQSADTLDSALGQKLMHKGFMLRGFYSDDRLHFDSAGNPLGTLHVGSWTTSLIQVESIHVASTKIELKASRGAQVYDEQSRFHSVRTSQHVHVVVDRDASATDAAVIGSVEHLFVNQNENMVNLVPEYWRAYVSGKLQIVPQEDGHPCRRIEGRALRNPDGSLWFPCEEHAKNKSNLLAPSDVTSLPYRCGKNVRPPVTTSTPEPEYEELAKSSGFEGGVDVLDLTLSTDGSISDIQILRPLGFGLDEKAVEAVRRWKFTPAKMDGRPVPAGIQVEVNFHLH